MSQEVTLKVFDIQGFSVNDGPGIRQTIFLQGCPLTCLWCHSPESQAFDGRILWLGPKCVGCLKCVAACPTGARSAIMPTSPDERMMLACDWDLCTMCGLCEKACLTKALYYSGTDRTIDELMVRIEQERPFYDRSGGGVTVSGGEALCQADGVRALLKRCKEAGVSTAVDTCGFINFKNIEKVLPYADIFLYDIKLMDSELHKHYMGVPNELILENIVKLAEAGGRLHIRIPLIPNINADDENIIATRDFLLGVKDAVDLIQVLPYHNLGTAKYDRLNLKAPEIDTFVPSDELVDHVVELFESGGFTVIVH